MKRAHQKLSTTTKDSLGRIEQTWLSCIFHLQQEVALSILGPLPDDMMREDVTPPLDHLAAWGDTWD